MMLLTEKQYNYLESKNIIDGNFWRKTWVPFEHLFYKLLGIDEKRYQIQTTLLSSFNGMNFEIRILHKSFAWKNTSQDIKRFRAKIYKNLSIIKRLGVSLNVLTNSLDETRISMHLSEQQAQKVIFMAVRKHGFFMDKLILQKIIK